jgi:hypothetical protein
VANREIFYGVKTMRFEARTRKKKQGKRRVEMYRRGREKDERV